MTDVRRAAMQFVYGREWRKHLRDARETPVHMWEWRAMKLRLARQFYNLAKEARHG